MIKVIIADGQYLVRRGLKCLLSSQSNIEVVGEAESGNRLLQLLKENSVDIVVFDYNKSKYFSKEDIDAIFSVQAKSKILIISNDQDKESIYTVIEKGVNSFLTKQCDEPEIINAINAIVKGDKFFCSTVLDLIMERSFPTSKTCQAIPLSEREREIVCLTADGKKAKEIATDLFLSTHTVYTHRKNIMRKLGLNSSSELVKYAYENGLVK